jgi:hypothetical protein
MKSLLCCCCTTAFALVAFQATAATPPYSENFDSYAAGDTPVTNFTETSTAAWTVASPSYSGGAYQNALSVVSSGVSVASAENASAAIAFPDLASSSFLLSTTFRIDERTINGNDNNNTATVGLFARGADATPATSDSDRYQVSYYLDADGMGHPVGRLWLREVNLTYGDSLNQVSTTALPIVIGDIYQLSLTGAASAGSLALTATLTNTTAGTSITVTDTDGANLLAGSNFGYFNHVFVEDSGNVALNVDFDNLAVAVPEPGTITLLTAALAALATFRRRHARASRRATPIK